jgi:hypothetical protein
VSRYSVIVVRAADPGTAVASCSTPGLSCSIPGLEDEVEYVVQVTAENQFGPGESAVIDEPVRTLVPIGLGQSLAAPGAQVDVWAGGFLPDSVVQVQIDDSAVLAEERVGADGRVEVAVGVPSELETKAVEIRVSGSSKTGSVRILRAGLMVDGVAPVVESVVLSVSELDVSDGPAEFVVSLVVRDDLSGVESVNVWVENPAGVTMLGSALTLVEGDASSGVWRATLTVPRYGMAGEWRVGMVSVRDAAFNEVYLDAADLAVFGPLTILVGHS